MVAMIVSGLFGISPAASLDKPNIIFILADDLGKEWIPAYGGGNIPTPHLDRMSREGLRFRTFYAMPICTPTRGALLTGRYPHHNGWLSHWDVPRWSWGKANAPYLDWEYNMTFARVMKSAGYRTAAAGKWQMNDFRTHPDAMVRHGFDAYAMWTGGEAGTPEHERISDQRYWDPYIHQDGKSRTHAGRFGEDVFADFLIDFMGRNRDKPLMLYYAMALAHAPYTSTPHKPAAATKEAKHRAMVEYMDLCVGRLLRAVDSLGLREKTLVVFATDNGTAGDLTGSLDGRSIQGGKETPWDRGCDVPFIAWGPGRIPPGVVTEALGDMTDMLPTFADFAGVDGDLLRRYYPLDGHSLKGVMTGADAVGPRKWILSEGNFRATLDAAGAWVPREDFAVKSIRDQDYKARINANGVIDGLWDMTRGAYVDQDGNNLLPGVSGPDKASLEKFQAVLATLPKRDARPVYTGAVALDPVLRKVVDLPMVPVSLSGSRMGSGRAPTAAVFSLPGRRYYSLTGKRLVDKAEKQLYPDRR